MGYVAKPPSGNCTTKSHCSEGNTGVRRAILADTIARLMVAGANGQCSTSTVITYLSSPDRYKYVNHLTPDLADCQVTGGRRLPAPRTRRGNECNGSLRSSWPFDCRVQPVGPLRLLAHQQPPSPEHHRPRLLLLTPHGHETHCRARCAASNDRSGVVGVVLLPLHVRFHLTSVYCEVRERNVRGSRLCLSGSSSMREAPSAGYREADHQLCDHPRGSQAARVMALPDSTRHPRNNPSSSSVPSRAGASAPSSKRSASSRLCRWSSTICSSMVPFVTSL